MNFYSVYNLNTRSAITLPGFQPGEPGKSVDVTIQFGKVDNHIDNPIAQAICFQASSEKILFLLPGIARILVTNGKTVTIEPLTNNKEEAIQLFLLNHVLSIVQHQQEKLVLHASVIQTGNTIVAFAGETGSGKSTLSAALCQQWGYRLFADEHCVLETQSDLGLLVLPGCPLIQLWEESLAYIGNNNISPLLPVRPEIKKYFLPLSQSETRCETSVPLNECYILKWCTGSEISIRKLSGQEKLIALLQQVYQWPYVKGMALQQQVFRQCSQLARQIKVFELQRPYSLHKLAATLDFLRPVLDQTADYDNRTTLEL